MNIKEWWFSLADCPACEGTGDQPSGVDYYGEAESCPCMSCDGTGKTTPLIAMKIKMELKNNQ